MGPDPAADFARPDVEALVWQAVKDIAPRGINTWAFTAVPLPAPTGWLIATSVQVDVRGQTKAAALARAMEARRRLLALPDADWPGGVVSRVRIIEDAWWNPDPDGGPRYTARFEVVVHPRPAERKERTA